MDIEITGLEANLLLFALDHMCGVSIVGVLKDIPEGYTRDQVQDLRDRLFDAHVHPDGD